MSEGEKVFKLKRSSIDVKEVMCNLYIWRCPLCGRVLTSHYYYKITAAAKLHVERVHSLKVVIEE
jgi:ribosomal protein L37AE/L43A